MRLLPAIVLLLAPTLAQAADIELDFTLVTVDLSQGEPAELTTSHAVTFHDVEEGPQPGLLVEGPAGRIRVEMDVSRFPAEHPDQTDQVQYDLEVWEHATDRKGRDKSEIISAPRLRANVDQPALVKQVARIPVDGPDGVEFLESSMQVELRWVEGEE